MNSAVAGLMPSLMEIDITFCAVNSDGMKNKRSVLMQRRFKKETGRTVFFNEEGIPVIY
jgi:hypothetical protein